MESLLETVLAWKALAVGAWLAGFFLLERLEPAAPPPQTEDSGSPGQRLLRNLAFWAGNSGLSLLIVIPVSLWAAENGLGWRPAWWSGWTGLVLDLLLLDFLIYWWHRANHVVPFLWRFHEVHHLDRTLDTTTAVRFHFGEVLLSAGARAAVILIFAIPIASVLVFEALVLMAAIFHHSNLRLPARLERALSRVVITPGIHWVHHHKLRRDTDSNYGTILSLWDPLFGSRSPTSRRLDMPIGVEGRREQGLWALLLRPFSGPRQAP
ncbi:MAG: sterol desaturase family protein [Rhodovibrionaceae bacterium]